VGTNADEVEPAVPIFVIRILDANAGVLDPEDPPPPPPPPPQPVRATANAEITSASFIQASLVSINLYTHISSSFVLLLTQSFLFLTTSVP
jgi:hypothetical protein